MKKKVKGAVSHKIHAGPRRRILFQRRGHVVFLPQEINQPATSEETAVTKPFAVFPDP